MIIKIGELEFKDWEPDNRFGNSVVRTYSYSSPSGIPYGVYIDIYTKSLHVSVLGDYRIQISDLLFSQVSKRYTCDIEIVKNEIDGALMKISKLIHFA